MLRTHAAFFLLLRSLCDIVIIGGCWIAVYIVRFHSGIFSVTKGIPSLKTHIILTLPIICICFVGCLWSGLYKPKRIQNMLRQTIDTLKAALLSGLLIFAFFYYINDAPYSRMLLALFLCMLILGLSFSHLFTMSVIRFLRNKGYNLRHYAVIGAGKKGEALYLE